MKPLFAFLTLLTALSSTAQIDPYFHVSTSAGIEIPLSSDIPADGLASLVAVTGNTAPYWEFVNSSVFFNEHLGVGLGFRMKTMEFPNGGITSLDNEVIAEYSADYFVDITPRYDNYDLNQMELSTAYLSLLARFKTSSVLFTPGVHIGLETVRVRSSAYDLKEIGGNRIYRLRYASGAFQNSEALRLGVGFSLEKMLGDKFGIGLHARLSYIDHSYSYDVQWEDVFEQSVSTNRINYSPHMLVASFGLGISYDFSNPLMSRVE